LVAILVTAALGAWVYVAGSRNSHPQAQPDETLIVIGQFSNYTGGVSGYNVAGRLQEALERELDAGRLPDIRAEVWPRVIADEQAARDAARHSGAALVIWGEYDSGRAVAHFTTHPGSESSDRPDVEKQAASPDELAATINSALPEEVRSAALFTVGQILIERGDLKRARALLSQAAARPPADPVALAGIYHLLAFTYERGADADIAAAVDYYTRAIDLNPTMVSAFNNRGAGYLRLGGEENVRRAIADLDRVIEQAPELVEPHLNRGLAYIRLGQTAAWQRDLEAALTLKPDHTGAHNALCWAHALSEQPEAALVYCDRALELDPEGPALDSRAIAYARLGRYPEAQADFEAYLAALERDRPDVFTALETRYRGWLDALAAGRNPFDAALIEQLRVEP
jgi:tetratricopeptide (TPR) repeat protein